MKLLRHFIVLSVLFFLPFFACADVIETDLGVIHYSQAPKTWDISIPENFQKVEIAVYQKADDIPSQYNGWQAYMKINGRDTWKFMRFDEKLGGIIYDFMTGQEVREKTGRNKYLDVTSMVNAGENTITYYHYNEGAGLGVRVRIYTIEKTRAEESVKKPSSKIEKEVKAGEFISKPLLKESAPMEEKLPPLRPDTFAVIIGIDYKGRQDIPNLQYPSQDAKKIYDILTDPRYGGVPTENTVLLLNEKATRNEMISALRKVKNWDGYVYVYFSGHGAPKTKEDKLVDAYLVPYDVVITDPEAMEDTSIKISYLQDLVNTSQAKGVMVALDACFSGGGKSIVPKGGKPLVLTGISPELIKPKGMGKVIITSSATNQQSWEDETEIKGGIFSYFLLEGLKGKAGKDIWVKADDLSNYIKENVPKTARKLKGVEQNPQVSGKGDFAVTKNWERAKVMDIEMARAKLKNAFEKGYITAEQLNKALDELKSANRSKTLEAFLEGKIDEKKFGDLY